MKESNIKMIKKTKDYYDNFDKIFRRESMETGRICCGTDEPNIATYPKSDGDELRGDRGE